MALMQKLQEIKTAAGADRVQLLVDTSAIPRVLLFAADNSVMSTQSPPEQDSDLLAWLDGILDGISI